MAQLLARLGAAVGPPQRRAELGTRLRMLELRRRVAQHLYRFLEQREPVVATLGQARGAKSSTKRPRRAPGARQLQLLAGEAAGFILLAELVQGEGGRRAPGDIGGIAAAD